MDNKELEQKNIIITEVNNKTWGLSITDEKGLKYNVPEFKKDTTIQTIAYKTLSELPKYGMGLNKCFKFVTVNNNQGGQSRYVRVVSEPQEGKTSTYVSPRMETQKPVIIEKEVTDWDKISWGKCKHAYLVEMFKIVCSKPELMSEINLNKFEKSAELWADMSMRKLNDFESNLKKMAVDKDYQPEDVDERILF